MRTRGGYAARDQDERTRGKEGAPKLTFRLSLENAGEATLQVFRTILVTDPESHVPSSPRTRIST